MVRTTQSPSVHPIKQARLSSVQRSSVRLKHLLAVCFFGSLLLPAGAEVVRLDVLQTTPAFGGRSFGTVGSYVRITARATIAVDLADPRNAVIADIDQAPRNAPGRVEAVADVVLLHPANLTLDNAKLLVEAPNRGRTLGPQLFDDTPQPGANNAENAADAGIGFLYQQGFSMAWIGWQADIPSARGQFALSAPSLQGVKGPARDEFVFDHTRSPATATLSSAVADPANLTVMVRAKWNGARQTPPGLLV